MSTASFATTPLCDIALRARRAIHWNGTSAWRGRRIEKKREISSETRVMRIRTFDRKISRKKFAWRSSVAPGCCMDRDTKDTPGVRGRGTTHSAPRVVSGSILLRDTFYAGITRRDFNPRRCLLRNSVIFPGLIVPRPFGIVVLVIVVVVVVVCP